MFPTIAGLIVVLCTFGGALIGRRLRSSLPADHVGSEARDTIELAFGLTATMAALVLGLVTASAKETFDSMNLAVKHAAMDTLVLDRLLARYGPETAEIRQDLRHAVGARIEMIWPSSDKRPAYLDPNTQLHSVEQLVDKIGSLEPKDELHKGIKTRANDLAEELLQIRWLQVTVLESSVPTLFLGILLGWMTVTFTCYGLLAPRNLTVFGALFLCSATVGSAVFLILELDGPFDGVLKVNPDLLRYAMEHLGQ